MRLSIVVPVFGSLDRTKAFWGVLRGALGCAADVELMVVDNGSPDGYSDWVQTFVVGPLFPPANCRLIVNGQNEGVPKAMNQGWRKTRGEVVAFLHNDLYVYEPGWDARVSGHFATTQDLGVVGFHGARRAEADGGRGECWSNMLEAERHGSRGGGVLPVALLDGMALVCRKAMLEAVGGFDESLGPHHYYDKDICMASIAAGYRNFLVGVACHHDGGKTACSSQYLAWAGVQAATREGAETLTSTPTPTLGI